MTLCFGFFGGGMGACRALFVSLITSITGGLGKPSFHLVKGPFWVLIVSAFLRCFISF